MSKKLCCVLLSPSVFCSFLLLAEVDQNPLVGDTWVGAGPVVPGSWGRRSGVVVKEDNMEDYGVWNTEEDVGRLAWNQNADLVIPGAGTLVDWFLGS